MKEALIVVDMCNDFVADDGRLTVGKAAQNLLPFIIEQCRHFIVQGGVVVFATDNHPEGIDGTWPQHCDPRTDGIKIYGQLGDWYDLMKDHPNVLYQPKTTYNAFWQTPLADWLRSKQITTVNLVGVCTDICVINTAAGAYFSGFKVNVLKKGCATITVLQKYETPAYEMMQGSYAATIVD
jgi:nicotinamidase-related amidase